MKAARPLRTALLANAMFSFVCAMLMSIWPTLVGVLLGIQAPSILRAVGLGLLVFAIDLVHQATRQRLAIWRALYASVGDMFWVIGSIVGLVLFPGVFSTTGLAIALAIAVMVLVFGIWQLLGILHLSKHAGARHETA